VIERIENIEGLRLIKHLDLSANRIRVISNLQGLFSLETLNLSGNKIVSMINLSQISGDGYKLRSLDISGNNLRELREIQIIDKLTSLRDLKLLDEEDEDDCNPFCRIRIEYLKTIQKLKSLTKLTVDGYSKGEINDMVSNYSESCQIQTINDKNSGIKGSGADRNTRDKSKSRSKSGSRSPSPNTKPDRNMPKKLPPKPDQSQLFRPDLLATMRPESAGVYNPQQQDNQKYLLEEIGYLKGKIKELELEVNSLQNEKKSNAFKIENTEKYWINKIKCTEDSYISLKGKLENAMRELESSQRSMDLLNQENSRIKELNQEFLQAHRDKDVSLEKLQDRISTLMQNNGDLFRQSQQMREDISHHLEEKSALNATIEQLRRTLSDYERNLHNLHETSIRTSSQGVERYTELTHRFKELQEMNEVLTRELNSSHRTVQKLQEASASWKSVIDSKLRESKTFYEDEIRDLTRRFEDQKLSISDEFKQTMLEKEEKFRNNMDKLEEEFRKILVETNNKCKKIKKSLENKTNEAVRFLV